MPPWDWDNRETGGFHPSLGSEGALPPGSSQALIGDVPSTNDIPTAEEGKNLCNDCVHVTVCNVVVAYSRIQGFAVSSCSEFLHFPTSEEIEAMVKGNT